MELNSLTFDEPEYSYGQLSEIEAKAWKLYCDETAGSMDVRDFWQELPLYVQHIYLEKIRNDKSKH